MEVSGAESLWAVGTTVNVGEAGFGTLEILDGGRVTSLNAIIADNTGSRGEATVDGAGSTWEITGTMDVSDPSEGKLTISNGGLVTTTGVVRVNAAGTLTLAGGRLAVGSASGLTNQGLVRGGGTITGLVTNSSLGEIRISEGDDLVLGNNLTNAGLIDLDGGEMEVLGAASNSSDIDVRDGILRFQTGLNNSTNGQLAFVGGDSDVFGAVTNAVGAEIAVGGTASVVFHDAVTNNGTLFIQPGGEVFMLENLGFGGGSALEIQLQEIDLMQPDTEPSDALGQVQVGGAATLAGELEVDVVGGYSPALGDSFQILTAGGGRSGFFVGETLPLLASGLVWDVQYNPNSVVLSVISAGLAGDYNANGTVDAADYVLWRKDVTPLTNEVAGVTTNDTTPEDYGAWRTRFGNPTPGGGGEALSGQSVPEPTTMLMLVVAAVGACQRRRRAK